MASSGGEDGEIGLQIAPLLDLLFVLLMFFMVTASSKVQENELGIKIPSNGKLSGTPQVPISLEIDTAGQVFFNKAPIDTPRSKEMTELKAKLVDVIAKFGAEQPVILSPVGTARQERVIDVLNACSAAHVKNLAFGAPPAS